jgi:hypothetical protein
LAMGVLHQCQRNDGASNLVARPIASFFLIIDICCTTWNALINQPGRIRSTCGYLWAAPVNIS